MASIVIALFIIAHGLVHPILAFNPGPGRDPMVISRLWTRSWLLGDGSTTKMMAYTGSVLACILLIFAGLSLMGWVIPLAWWHTLGILGAVISLVTLVICWHRWFIVGVVIDTALLLLIANWNSVAIAT